MLSPAAKKGIARLCESLPRSKAAEVLERAERASESAIALAELEKEGRGSGVLGAVAGALRDELDGVERDPWGTEDGVDHGREEFVKLIAQREAAGDQEGAAALRSDLAAHDREQAALAGAAAAREERARAAASEQAEEKAEIAALFGDGK